MSMPGFVYHLYCPRCRKASDDYPLYVFPDLFRCDIVLPAWSRGLECYAEVRCNLGQESRGNLEGNNTALRTFVHELSSSRLTVGYPTWTFQEGEISVLVEPAPACPFCGAAVEARSGHSSRQTEQTPLDVGNPDGVPLGRLGLSVRALNCLQSAGIHTLAQICERSVEELLALPRLGESAIEQIRERVRACGYKLRGE